MYNSIKEVLITVREKFAQATSLSKDDGCFYKHTVNGIGCAIGCLYEADVAEEMDSLGAIRDWSRDEWTIYKEDVFGHQIHRDSLRVLQEKHDTSDTVEQFLFILDHRIATGHWMSVEKVKEII